MLENRCGRGSDGCNNTVVGNVSNVGVRRSGQECVAWPNSYVLTHSATAAHNKTPKTTPFFIVVNSLASNKVLLLHLTSGIAFFLFV